MKCTNVDYSSVLSSSFWWASSMWALSTGHFLSPHLTTETNMARDLNSSQTDLYSGFHCRNGILKVVMVMAGSWLELAPPNAVQSCRAGSITRGPGDFCSPSPGIVKTRINKPALYNEMIQFFKSEHNSRKNRKNELMDIYSRRRDWPMGPASQTFPHSY